jgi:hypothetical protein
MHLAERALGRKEIITTPTPASPKRNPPGRGCCRHRIDPARRFTSAQISRVLIGLIGLLGEAWARVIETLSWTATPPYFVTMAFACGELWCLYSIGGA